MNHTEHIYDLLDGNLSPDKENALFSELLTDQQARGEFKNLLNVKMSLSQNRQDASLEPEEKSQLFQTIGLGLPVASIGSVNDSTNVAPTNKFGFNKFIWPFGAAVVTFLLTYFLLIPDDPAKQASVSAFSSSEMVSTNTKPVRLVSKKTPVTPPEYMQNNPTVIIKKVPVVVYKERESSSHQASAPVDVKKENNSNAIPDESALLIDKEVISPMIALGEAKTLYNPQSQPEKINPYDPPRLIEIPLSKESSINQKFFAAELSASNYFYFEPRNIGPKRWADFNNTNLSFLFTHWDNVSYGLEYKRENFYLKYSGQEKGMDYYYEQQPNFNTLSLALRYKFADIFGFMPNVRISTGLNEVGVVVRGGFGIDYYYTAAIDFTVSGDYSTLIFERSGKTYQTEKFGFNYGIKYKF